MIALESNTAVPYPTPHLQGLFPSVCATLTQLDAVVTLARATDKRVHRRMLINLDELLSAHYEVLALFLAHPTRRLSDLLSIAVTSAEEAIGWLIDNPPAPPGATPCDFSYPVLCERVRRGIADWRLSIALHRVYYDLDDAPIEAVH